MNTLITKHLVKTGMVLFGAVNGLAASTSLPFRFEAHGAFTAQTVERSYGANLTTLGFTNTTTYSFFSPQLQAPVTLRREDKVGGKLFMRSTATRPANDFKVIGRLQIYDYDSATGTEVLIADTKDSGHKDIHHGRTEDVPLPDKKIETDTTLVAGHRLHVAVTITLVSGNPGQFGQFLFNGPKDPKESSVALFPQNRRILWSFAELPVKLSIGQSPNGVVITCAGDPNESYLIQATTDLGFPVWTTLTNRVTDSAGFCSFTDPETAKYPCRFYRAVTAY